MSIKVQTEVWKNSQHKGSALLLMLAIADFADDDGVAFPSIGRLAQKMRMTERAIHYLLSHLEASGELVIERQNGPNRCNLFRVQTFQGETGFTLKEDAKSNKNKPVKSLHPESGFTLQSDAKSNEKGRVKSLQGEAGFSQRVKNYVKEGEAGFTPPIIEPSFNHQGKRKKETKKEKSGSAAASPSLSFYGTLSEKLNQTQKLAIALKEESGKQKKIVAAQKEILILGEHGWVKVTAQQYQNLKNRLHEELDHYIAAFDGWVQEAPKAKKNGVRRCDQDSYASIQNWHRRNTHGRQQKFETKGEALIRKQKEAGSRARELLRGAAGNSFWPDDPS